VREGEIKIGGRSMEMSSDIGSGRSGNDSIATDEFRNIHC
jgi:hypothetical protein